MAVSSTGSYSSSAFGTTGVRPSDTSGRGQPAQVVEQNQQQQAQPQQRAERTETQPSERQRDEALSQGRDRGSFVDVRA